MKLDFVSKSFYKLGSSIIHILKLMGKLYSRNIIPLFDLSNGVDIFGSPRHIFYSYGTHGVVSPVSYIGYKTRERVYNPEDG